MRSNNHKSGALVYSTDHGRICPECQKPQAQCVCAELKKQVVKGDGTIRVRRETKGRAGKTVSSITGVALNEKELEKLLGDLKRKCGSGGTLKDGVLEIQGDHCEAILRELAERGFKAKRAGG